MEKEVGVEGCSKMDSQGKLSEKVAHRPNLRTTEESLRGRVSQAEWPINTQTPELQKTRPAPLMTDGGMSKGTT